MNDTVHIFRTVTLRPHWFQYVINEFVALCFFLGSIWVWEFCSFQYHELAKYVGIALFLYLLFKLIYLARMEYVILGNRSSSCMVFCPTLPITSSCIELWITGSTEAFHSRFSD